MEGGGDEGEEEVVVRGEGVACGEGRWWGAGGGREGGVDVAAGAVQGGSFVGCEGHEAAVDEVDE